MRSCKADGCQSEVAARGLCNRHYLRLRKYGDIRTTRVGGPVRQAAASYWAVHARLKSDRGLASAFPCVTCQGRASQWAYLNNDPDERVSPEGLRYSVDPSRYVPMCSRCHKNFDNDRAGKAACGTDAGYYRHRRRGGTPCNACKTAHALAAARRIASRRGLLTDPDKE